jgi:hypothetical protein
MLRFASDKHFASWMAMRPGANVMGSRQRHGVTTSWGHNVMGSSLPFTNVMGSRHGVTSPIYRVNGRRDPMTLNCIKTSYCSPNE